MSQTQSSSEISGNQYNLPKLREYLAEFFSMAELELLCFDLGVDFEDIRAEGKARTTMLLIQYFQRRKELAKLLRQCKKARTNVDWDDLDQQAAPVPQGFSEAEIRQTIYHLKELDALLDESWAAFKAQNKLRNRLRGMLFDNYSIPPYEGYNDLFYKLHDQMNQEEMELFRLIRGMTEGTIFRLNDKLRQWVNDHPVYQLLPESASSTEMIEEEMLQLKIHFNSWFDKYNAVFLHDGKQSLVYLNDEKRQGTGFPRRLKPVVTQVINELESQR